MKLFFFPIVAIEEPEAHLHPNAQKKLYEQIANIPGQKNHFDTLALHCCNCRIKLSKKFI
jgi:predicted ATPase